MADRNENNTNETNTYVNIASRVKKIRYVIVTILVIFVALAIFSYREDLTIENFRYLMKYVNVKPVVFGSNDNTQINFESDSATIASSFKEDLVILTKSSLKIYDMTSTEILESTHSINSPQIALGEKYFAVYDLGGKYLAIYNSFAKLWETTLDYPIYDVSIDEEGNFCVCTGAADHTSALIVYDSRFEKIFSWKSVDKYAVCADITTDEKTYMSVGTVKSTPEGDILSNLLVMSRDSSEVLSTLGLDSEMIMNVKFNGDSNIVCLTDKALRVYSVNGEMLSVHNFDSKFLRNFAQGDKWSVLVLNENIVGKDHRVIIFDTKGNTYFETDIESEITDLCVSDGYAFLLGVEDVTVIDIQKKESESFGTDRSYRSIELINNSNVYLVYDSVAFASGVSTDE